MSSINNLGNDNKSSKAKEENSFMDMLENTINDVNQKQLKANQMTQMLASGQSEDIAGTMLSLAKADISMKFLIQVRNKALNAYDAIMHIQL